MSADGRCWPGTSGNGPGTRSSPTPGTWTRPSLRRIHRSLKTGRSWVVEERDLAVYDELFGVAIPDDARELSGAGR
ncbi:hypothetical protein [Arthrobacter sp. FB24]|uniref:hypothetical protein n=1 Tax=Arthrobacter sp. (strain FB24) TaxID=290399 RepID=UPI0018DBD984|nr:hypothetical protein [Arthrobacter sp. FB24]